jgi:Ulp1 family protease
LCRTWFLSFDSLGGEHPAALKTLRDYLTMEARYKKGLELDSSASIFLRKVPVSKYFTH